MKYFTEIARKVEECKSRRNRRGRDRDKKKGLPVCRSELCERNDVNTRLCRSSMQRSRRRGGREVSQATEKRPDKEHPRSLYVDTRRSEVRDTKGETRKTAVRR